MDTRCHHRGGRAIVIDVSEPGGEIESAKTAWDELRPDSDDVLDDDTADAFGEIMEKIVADRARDLGPRPIEW